MSIVIQNSVYVLRDKNNQELLALCNLEDYFVDGDEVKLVQFFTQKHTDEDNLQEFTKIDFALYYEDLDKLVPLTKKYKIEKYVGEFTEVVEKISSEKKISSGNNATTFSVSLDKLQKFLENMISPRSNLL